MYYKKKFSAKKYKEENNEKLDVDVDEDEKENKDKEDKNMEGVEETGLKL